MEPYSVYSLCSASFSQNIVKLTSIIVISILYSILVLSSIPMYKYTTIYLFWCCLSFGFSHSEVPSSLVGKLETQESNGVLFQSDSEGLRTKTINVNSNPGPNQKSGEDWCSSSKTSRVRILPYWAFVLVGSSTIHWIRAYIREGNPLYSGYLLISPQNTLMDRLRKIFNQIDWYLVTESSRYIKKKKKEPIKPSWGLLMIKKKKLL